MRIFGRLILIPLGLVLAFLISGAFLFIASFAQPALGGAIIEGAVATLTRLAESLMEDGSAADRFGRLAGGLSNLSISILILPAALVAVVSEIFGMRQWLVQAIIAALFAAVLPWAAMPNLMAGQPLASTITGLLLATGAIAGTVYWMIAGRSAGPEPKSIEDRATYRMPKRK
jgi:hypothetical protein